MGAAGAGATCLDGLAGAVDGDLGAEKDRDPLLPEDRPPPARA